MFSIADWLIIAAYLVISMVLGIICMRRGRASSEQYFKSGGGTTWWLLGTSIVATTFAADTPLALSGMVVTSGISQNWYWWSAVPQTILVVFFFAALWKRANPLTDMEFVNMRYSGKSASFLRGFKALYFAFPFNCLIMGWVNLAMANVINLTFPKFPRLPFLDKFILYIFMITPLSSNVNNNVREAYFRGKIEPLAIADHYNLNTYNNIWTFAEYRSNVFEKNPQAMLKRLGLADNLTTRSLKGFYGISDNLYKSGQFPEAPEMEAANKEDKTNEVRLVRPVRLSDGSLIEYTELQGLSDRALDIGKQILVEENRSVKIEKPLLAGVTTPQLLNDIHSISSGVNQYKVLILLFLITVCYTAISGLWGVMITDFFQFWLAMFGCVMLAIFAVHSCGGMQNLFSRMVGIYGLEKSRAMVSVIPTAKAHGLGLMSIGEFLIYILIAWWAVGFTDGGLYAAQRMLSAKDERHAALGYLWYAIANYAIRMWPWLVVGFAAAVLFPYAAYPNGDLPGTAIAEMGYIRVMLRLLGTGWLGLLIATFLAAYMSTISTQINLGASYLLNDFYRPFIKKGADEKHYVRMGTYASIVMAFCGIVVCLFLNNIKDAWFLLSSIISGIGLINILRWYWSRINAWSEISCFVMIIFDTVALRWFELRYNISIPFPYNLLIIAPTSVIFALVVTIFTNPVDKEKLIGFCKKVQPGGPGWREIEDEIRKEDPNFKSKTPLTRKNFINWVLATISVYCWLFGIGKLIVGDTLYPNAIISNRLMGVILIIIGSITAYIVARSFTPSKWAEHKTDK
jgi:Na+/proline symporter